MSRTEGISDVQRHRFSGPWREVGGQAFERTWIPSTAIRLCSLQAIACELVMVLGGTLVLWAPDGWGACGIVEPGVQVTVRVRSNIGDAFQGNAEAILEYEPVRLLTTDIARALPPIVEEALANERRRNEAELGQSPRPFVPQRLIASKPPPIVEELLAGRGPSRRIGPARIHDRACRPDSCLCTLDGWKEGDLKEG